MKPKQKIIVASLVFVLLAVALLMTAFFVNRADRNRYHYDNFIKDGYTFKVFVKVNEDYVDVTENVSGEDGIEFEDGYVYRLEIYDENGEINSAKEVDLVTKSTGFYGRVKNFGLLKTIWVLIACVAAVGATSFLISYCTALVRKFVIKKKKQMKVD